MNDIIKNYNLLVTKYQKIEVDVTENEIHDKRVILRRIFPILAAYKINPSKVKNGEKAFKLFGKLRDVQVQLLKLESIDQSPEIIDYLSFLKADELELKEKVSKFCKKKELEFPVIKKKYKIDTSKIIGKTKEALDKLIERIQSRSIDDAEDVHKIRIAFKKFRYKVEILSYIDTIEVSKLEMLKIFQDKLGEIQDYEVLINGIKKYCKKRKLEEEEMIELFEHDQNTLIENFDNQIELFIAVCKDVLVLNNDVESPDEAIIRTEKTALNEKLTDIKNHTENSTADQVGEIIDLLIAHSTSKDNDAKGEIKSPVIETVDAKVVDKNQVSEKKPTGTLKTPKPKSGKKLLTDKDLPVESDHSN